MFKYVHLTFPAQCLERMRNLCLSDREFGGRFEPSMSSGSCKLDCRNVKLVHGTSLQDDNPDAALYTGQSPDVTVRIAVTPLYKEVFSTSLLCQSDDKVNMFFHTHPLLMDESGIGYIAPPSIGDFFAHGLLSNVRNYRQNGVINMPVVMAREGLYCYNILAGRFADELDEIDRLIEKHAHNLTTAERDNLRIGELPLVIIDELKQRIFDDLRPAHDEFFRQMSTWIQDHVSDLRTDGAVALHDGGWHKTTAMPTCNFDQSLAKPWFRQFCQSNVIVSGGMTRVGFICVFVPGPFTDDVRMLCPNEFVRTEKIGHGP